MHYRLFVTLSLLVLHLAAGAVQAQPQPETVIEGLTAPQGIAIQPETDHVFVADSGAGRIIRVVDGKAEEVVTGFPLEEPSDDSTLLATGPLGLAFLDRDTLAVGCGRAGETAALVRVYTVPAEGEPALKADAMKAVLGPLPPTEELAAEGSFPGVTVNPHGIFATSSGADAKGWIATASLTGTKLGEFQRFIASGELSGVGAPAAITTSPQGVLVVGQMGETTAAQDSVLTFYHAQTGKLLLNLKTGLYDMTGLAYSPQGHLYATDRAPRAPAADGLYRLDAAGQGSSQRVAAVKILALDQPTGLAFDSEGALYLTIMGPANENGPPGGKLLKLAPGL